MKLEIQFNKKDLSTIKDCAEYLLYTGGNSDFMVENRDFLIELKNTIKRIDEVEE